MTSESASKSRGSWLQPRRNSSRCFVLVVVIIIASILYFTVLLPDPEEWEPSGLRKFVGDESEMFTIVINSFQRHSMLTDALEHYSRCEYVKHIHVAWCEKEGPPTAMTNKFNIKSSPMVSFDMYEDSLNARFHPLSAGNYRSKKVSNMYVPHIFQLCLYRILQVRIRTQFFLLTTISEFHVENFNWHMKHGEVVPAL